MCKATDEPNRCEPCEPQLHRPVHRGGGQSGAPATTTLAAQEKRTKRTRPQDRRDRMPPQSRIQRNLRQHRSPHERQPDPPGTMPGAPRTQRHPPRDDPPPHKLYPEGDEPGHPVPPQTEDDNRGRQHRIQHTSKQHLVRPPHRTTGEQARLHQITHQRRCAHRGGALVYHHGVEPA